MTNFNHKAFKPNVEATLEMAERRLIDNGYKNFTFKSVSRTNGVSFYFLSENGEEIRVSDHFLTGRRAFTTIQVSLFELKKLKAIKKQQIDSDLDKRIKEAIKKNNN